MILFASTIDFDPDGALIGMLLWLALTVLAALMALAGIVFGLLALYLTWVWYLFIWSNYNTFVFSPNFMFAVMRLFGQTGIWTLMV